MADARVTTAQENPLCTRLKEKFDGRGVGRANVQTGTFERVRTESKTAQRAKAVANPFEETAQYVRAEAKARDKAARTVRFEKISKNMDAAAAKRRVEAYEVSTPFASGAYSAAYARAAEIRARAYDGSEAREACRREARRNEKKKGPIPFTPKWFRSILVGNEEEEFVKKAPVSAGLVIGILLFCAVVMMIVFSFAQISEFKKEIARELTFMSYAPSVFISALTGQRVTHVIEMAKYVAENRAMRVPTGQLNNLIADATMMKQPPSDKGKRLKIYYVSQVGVKPPLFSFKINSRPLMHFSYSRYLENKIREAFGFEGTSLKFVFREKGEKEEE